MFFIYPYMPGFPDRYPYDYIGLLCILYCTCDLHTFPFMPCFQEKRQLYICCISHESQCRETYQYSGIFNDILWQHLTHWGRVTHICVSMLTIIGSDNGLPPDRCQAIIWTNTGIWLIRTLGTNFIEILGEVHSFSFKKMHLKMSSAKGRLFNFGLNELRYSFRVQSICEFGSTSCL